MTADGIQTKDFASKSAKILLIIHISFTLQVVVKKIIWVLPCLSRYTMSTQASLIGT